MEAKKKEHLKLEKNSGLYFVIGMTLILALVYIALEWKTFDRETDWEITQSALDNLDPEIPPITFTKPPPSPPKQIATPEIKIADDDDDIVEDVIKSTESNPDDEIKPKDITFDVPPVIDDEIPFMVIEEVPVFPGCEEAGDKRACFQEKMLKHVKKNFRYPESAIKMGQQGRVTIVFTIQKDGSIGNVKMRSPHRVLEDEAARIISKLPRMEPGKQRGQAVKVPFSIPITFKLQ